MRKISKWIAVVLFFSCLPTAYAQSRRAIPDDNLGYPVLVRLESCPPNLNPEGSGFYINTENATFFVTARHMLFVEDQGGWRLRCKSAELISLSRDPKKKERNI